MEEYKCPLCNGKGKHIWLQSEMCSCSKTLNGACNHLKFKNTCKESPCFLLDCLLCRGTGKITWLQRVFNG